MAYFAGMTFSKFEGSARLFWAAIALLPGLLMAQTATISGTVVDAEARYPLLGATVQVLTVPDLVSMADLDGRFTLDNVPLGRHALQVSFIGYEPRVLEGIVVTSGRPVVLSVELQESVVAMRLQRSWPPRKEVMNDMATVSARAFTVEETDRSRIACDPARMASNFAGVQGADDSRNDIVVRGNSPNGVLWRVEGVDLPNPNHFSVLDWRGPWRLSTRPRQFRFLHCGVPRRIWQQHRSRSICGCATATKTNGTEAVSLDSWARRFSPRAAEPRKTVQPSHQLPVFDRSHFLGLGIDTARAPCPSTRTARSSCTSPRAGWGLVAGVSGNSSVDILISTNSGRNETSMATTTVTSTSA